MSRSWTSPTKAPGARSNGVSTGHQRCFEPKCARRDWHQRHGSGVHADTIMGRTVHSIIRVEIGGHSMSEHTAGQVTAWALARSGATGPRQRDCVAPKGDTGGPRTQYSLAPEPANTQTTIYVKPAPTIPIRRSKPTSLTVRITATMETMIAATVISSCELAGSAHRLRPVRTARRASSRPRVSSMKRRISVDLGQSSLRGQLSTAASGKPSGIQARCLPNPRDSLTRRRSILRALLVKPVTGRPPSWCG